MKRTLSQQEIDALFSGAAPAKADAVGAVEAFDFSRLDRIPKSQIRAVHLLHETFIRNLTTSLAGYLREHVSPSLISLEQISYGEFLGALESPTCLAYVSLRPFEGAMLIEIGRPFVFACVELLLGGGIGDVQNPARKLTDIEKDLMHNLLRVFLADFREAWRSVADIHFEVQSLADEPHGLRVLTAAEAVVAVSIEVKLGSVASMINMAIPSIFVKRLRDKFERLQSAQQSDPRRADEARMAALLRPVQVEVEARVDGGTMSVDDLAGLEVGDVLMFDVPVDRPIGVHVNGEPLFFGHIAADAGRMRCAITADRLPE